MPFYFKPLVLLSILGLCLSTIPAAQSAPEPPTETTRGAYEPLRPANTSSPRDSLETFINDYQLVLDEHFSAGKVTSSQGLAAYDRAVSTMDFSNTPDGGSRWIQTEYLVYYKEVLDKLDLPPMSKIPNAFEAKQAGLTEWSIPNTRITYKLETSGPRKGEWLLSAKTVQLLPRFYRQMRELPYKSGAQEGLYEELMKNRDGTINREREIGNRLRSVNMNSPRATLEGFLKNMNQAYTAVHQVHEGLNAEPPTMSKKEAEVLGAQAEDSLERAISTLNLSDVPDALRYDRGIEAAMQIKEIMDRLAPPPIEQVPDLEMIREMRKEMHDADQPIRWIYPMTSIEIVEIMDGDNRGTFKFSPRTVEIADSDYQRIKDLPYRDRHFNHFSAKYESAETSPGFYNFYASTPGNLIPEATSWGRFISKLPPFFHREYHEQSVWQWCALVLLYLLAIIAAIVVIYVINRLIKHCRPPFPSWLRLLTPILISGIVFWVTRAITNEVNITGHTILMIITVQRTIQTLLLSWAAFCLCRAIVETVIALPQIKEESVDASLLRLSSRMIGIILAIWVIITGLEDLGLDIWPLIAGLGVGGLAVALAFRPTMENIIGSFMIFADKPYKVGQRVKVLGADGTVESIGLRSTKIRLLSGHLTTIPNEKMASVQIENIGQRPFIRRVFDVTITYDTKPTQINRAVDIIREILAVPETTESDEKGTDPHPNERINQPDFPPRVYFNNLNSDSLNILVIYWYHPPQYWDFLEHANWVNVQIMERFAAEGIDFAFPTQSLHLSSDPRRPLSVGQRWESDEEGQSPLHLFSQAAAFGAHSALGNVSFASASDAVKPEPEQPKPTAPNENGDTTDAPIEDGIVDADGAEDGNTSGSR